MTDSSVQGGSELQLIRQLAGLWCRILESDAPPDWSRNLAGINFDTPCQSYQPQQLPVLEYLPRMMLQAPIKYKAFIETLIRVKHRLFFGQTYDADDFGKEFLSQYGWLKIIGPDGYWYNEESSGGILLLGESVTYPLHWHDAEELYLPVSGNALWFLEHNDWQPSPTGKVIHHVSNIKHATRTTGEPLMAFYLWRGGDLVQKSTIIQESPSRLLNTDY